MSQHIPLRKVGTLCINAENAILTLNLDLSKITNTLASMLTNTKVEDEIDLIETWLKDISEATNFLHYQQRERRDVISWLASVTGLYNYLKLNQVNKKMENINSASSDLNKETQQIFHHITAMDANLIKLSQILRGHENALWNLDTILHKELTWRNAERTVSAVRELIETLPQHRVSPDAVLLFDFEKEWKILQDKVKSKGKELAVPSWHYALHSKTSYWTDRTKVLIAISIPIKDRHTTSYELYKIQPTPFLLNDRFYRALTQHQFIAVHAITQASIALTDEQINTFSTQVLDTRYYHGPVIENQGDQRECIEALWTNTSEIETWCHLIATNDKEYAHAINNSAVLWITNNITTITVQCPNQPTEIKQVIGSQILNINPSCTASSTRLTFRPTPNANEHIDVFLKTWHSPINKTTWGLQSWTLQQPPTIENKFEKINNLLQKKVNLIPTWIAITIACVALIITLLFIIWLYVKAKQQWKFNTPEIPETNNSD